MPRGSTTLALGIAVAVVVAVSTGARAQHASPIAAPPAPPSLVKLSPATTSAAVNGLLRDIKARANEDESLPLFARQRVKWLTARQRAGELAIVLLNNPAGANLDADALMASGDADGQQVIAISGPRLARFLLDEGPTSAPFNRRQHNDFLLGLVHETVHLERRQRADTQFGLDARLDEEVRAWRTVDLQVVRPLLKRHEPMNPRFVEADAAIRSCGDKEPCQPLRELLLPSERLRR